MSNKEVLQFLLVKEQEMVNRFHGVISEIIRIENPVIISTILYFIASFIV